MASELSKLIDEELLKVEGQQPDEQQRLLTSLRIKVTKRKVVVGVLTTLIVLAVAAVAVSRRGSGATSGFTGPMADKLRAKDPELAAELDQVASGQQPAEQPVAEGLAEPKAAAESDRSAVEPQAEAQADHQLEDEQPIQEMAADPANSSPEQFAADGEHVAEPADPQEPVADEQTAEADISARPHPAAAAESETAPEPEPEVDPAAEKKLDAKDEAAIISDEASSAVQHESEHPSMEAAAEAETEADKAAAEESVVEEVGP
ncbi:hypothetical protein WJX72_006026 [[Myrmecia] bisecta]|uniref:Uncharacterized protein n=1 Tax=[Myrmecia] bisecta TaxID=41462 RepID=A0AAW1R7F7_9CHLO